MAPTAPTEDYYFILEVEQTDDLPAITKSYRRLAIILHPDKSKQSNATAVFQSLTQAYEILKDEALRRSYDRDYYSSLRRSRPSTSQPYDSTREKQTPPAEAPPKPSSKPQPHGEAAQFVALQKSMHERSTRWHAKKTDLESLIAAGEKAIFVLKQRIDDLRTIAKDEAASEAETYEWMATVTSRKDARKHAREGEKLRREENLRNGRGKQERRVEMNLKERVLAIEEAKLEKIVTDLSQAKHLVDAADEIELKKIQVLQASLRAKEDRERQARETEERERREQRARDQHAERWRRRRQQQQDRVRERERQREEEVAEAQRQAQKAEEESAEAQRQAQKAEEDKAEEEKAEERKRYEQWTRFRAYMGAAPICQHKGR